MKKFFLTTFTILFVVIMIAVALCIGNMKNFQNEREQILLSCEQMHSTTSWNLEASIESCEEAAERFDDRLEDTWPGVAALACGVQPVWDEVNARHEALLENWEYAQTPEIIEEVRTLINENYDTIVALWRVLLIILVLLIIFCRRKRKK